MDDKGRRRIGYADTVFRRSALKLCFAEHAVVDDIDVLDHREQVARIVAAYLPATVEVVPDIAEWCAENSGGQYTASDFDNPIGKALWNSPTEPDRILLRNFLTKQQVENHLLALFLKGFGSAYDLIPNAPAFLAHLVLHEVAHIKHDWRQDRELDCDRWAFAKLNRWVET